MGDDVRMDYDAMTEMIQAFRRSAHAFEDVRNDLTKAARLIQEGGLVSETGERWADSLLSRLVPAVERSIDGFEKIARELDGAMRDLRDGDIAARSRFSG